METISTRLLNLRKVTYELVELGGNTNHLNIPEIQRVENAIIVKTLFFSTSTMKVIAVLPVLQQIDYIKLAKALLVPRNDIKLVSKDTVENDYHLPIGSVNPIIDIPDSVVIVDSEIPRNDNIICGSGHIDYSIKISVPNLAKAINFTTHDIQKKFCS